MKINTLVIILLFGLISMEMHGQYWVRADMTIADADAVGDALLRIQVRINGNNIINLEDTFDGSSNSEGRNDGANQAFPGAFPSQVQFFNSASGLGNSGDINQTGSCSGGNFTNTVPTDGNLFLGPFDGGSSTYFECDQILDPSTIQFFQVWRLNDLPQPNGTENERCIDQTVVLDPGNFGASIRNVQYQTNEMSSPETLISFFPNTVHTYEVDLSTVPNIETASTIRFRLHYGSSIFTDYVIYTLTGCSPEIVEEPTVQNTTCSYTNDGGFTVTFDRPLDDGEMLTNIGIYRDNGDGVLDIVNGLDVFSQPDPPYATYTGTTFAYPEPLSPGNYFFSYQTDNENTAQFSELIEITAPPALEYDIGVASGLSCFDSSDGEVEITINPNSTNSVGTPPYYYTINNGSPITFTGTSTIVTGLGSTALEFKVFDSNDCTQRH